jgi:DNA replication protein DnaC
MKKNHRSNNNPSPNVKNINRVIFNLPQPQIKIMKKLDFIKEHFRWSKKFDVPPEKLITDIRKITFSIFQEIGYQIQNINEFIKIIDFIVGLEIAFMNTSDISPTNKHQKIIANYEIQGKQFKFPKGLVLYGPTGTGKTTAAKIIENTFDEVKFIDIEEITRKYMRSNGNDWLDDFIETHEKHVLIIDDIGSETEMKKFGNSSPMVSILTERTKSWEWYGIPTVYTTNISNLGELGNSERYGERIASRIKGSCTGVCIAGNDNRSLYN